MVLAGCTGSVGTADVKGIQQANEAAVSDCEFLGDVTGVSGFYGMFATSGLQNAKVAAQRKAKEMGADTIVLREPNMADSSTSITGAAYRCASQV
jgi:hypothetical protein